MANKGYFREATPKSRSRFTDESLAFMESVQVSHPVDYLMKILFKFLLSVVKRPRHLSILILLGVKNSNLIFVLIKELPPRIIHAINLKTFVH